MTRACCGSLDLQRFELASIAPRRFNRRTRGYMTVRPAVLRRSPTFVIATITTLGMTIALAAVVFAIVDGVLFKPLPYGRAHELYAIVDSSAVAVSATLSPFNIAALREADKDMRITAFRTSRTVRSLDQPLVGMVLTEVDEYFFDVLDRRPMVGGFRSEDFQHATESLEAVPAVVSYAFWNVFFGGERSALGRTITLIGSRLLIVGVLPRDFAFPHSFGRTRRDILVPLPSPRLSSDNMAKSLFAVARVPSASRSFASTLITTVGAANAELADTAGPMIAVRPRLRLLPLNEQLGLNERPFFSTALSGAGLLVLLGCANVAALLSARARARQADLRIRVALGARKRDLMRLLLTETVWIALAGAAVGLALASPLLKIALELLPDRIYVLKSPTIDWRVIVFAVVTSTLTMTAVALWPLLSYVRGAAMHPMYAVAFGIGQGPRWWNKIYIVVQVAVGVVLTIFGSLMVTSVLTLRAVDPGIDRKLAVLQVAIPDVPPAQRKSVYRAVFERLRATPGVLGVAFLDAPFLENTSSGSRFRTTADPREMRATDVPVSRDFFEVSGLRVIEGRALTAGEIEAGSPVAVVSERVARLCCSAGNALGQVLVSAKDRVTIVGVVEEVRLSSQSDAAGGEIYIPAALGRGIFMTYLVKAAGSPDVVIRDAALRVNRDIAGVATRRAESLEAALRRSVQVDVFRAALFGTAGGAAVLLLSVGVFGVVLVSVSQRLRELGIRSALGGTPQRLAGTMLLSHLYPMIIGLGIGLLISWWGVKLIESMLYEIDAREPFVWLITTSVLLGLTTFAGWIPAAHAARVDPMSVLRED